MVEIISFSVLSKLFILFLINFVVVANAVCGKCHLKMKHFAYKKNRIHPFFEGEPLQPLALVSVGIVTTKSNHKLVIEKPILPI